MNWSKQKKIISVILILAVFVLAAPLDPTNAQVREEDEDVSFFGPDSNQGTGASTADSNATPRVQGLYQQISQLTCSEGTVLGACVSRLLAWITFWILTLILALFQVFGMLFDLSTAITLDPATYNLEPIRAGWAIARDTANLFFIFILLTMAIATILQIETYSAKKLLPNLIFAALFINFSFLMTQYVIYSSNLLAGFFLPGSTEVRAGLLGAPSGSASNSLSVKFLAGVNPNRMLASANLGNTYNEIEKVQNRLQEVKATYSEDMGAEEEAAASAEEKKLSNELKTLSNSKDLLNTTFQLSIAMFGTAVFILFAMFALAVAGLSLLIRVVMLWFLMILSPIAFLFFVLPGLSGEARKWWDTLLKQAFFAPGFFFLFGLTVEMIAGGSAEALFGADQQYQGAFITSFTVIGYYTLLIIMLLASVAFAKSFGSYSGQWASKGASALRGYALGYAGRTGRVYTAQAARGVMKTGAGKALAHFPLVGRVVTAATGIDRKVVSGYEKQYQTQSTEALKALRSGAASTMQLLGPAQREAIDKVLKAREKKSKRERILDDPNASSREVAAAMGEEQEETEAKAGAAEAELANERAKPKESE